MSIGGMGGMGGIAASVAGTQLAQVKGTEVDRTQRDAIAQQRSDQGELKAEMAAGIGETNGEDHETAERDADGRLPWKFSGQSQASEPSAEETPQTVDPKHESGGLLDLTG